MPGPSRRSRHERNERVVQGAPGLGSAYEIPDEPTALVGHCRNDLTLRSWASSSTNRTLPTGSLLSGSAPFLPKTQHNPRSQVHWPTILSKLAAMYLRRLEIENLRSLENVVFEPNVPGENELAHPNVTLVLGNNGLGKTSVLRAVALAVLSPVIASSSGYVPYSLVRRAGDDRRTATVRAQVALHAEQGEGAGEQTLGIQLVTTSSSYVDRAKSEVENDIGDVMWDEESPAFLVVGYGAGRRTESKDAVGEHSRLKSRALRYGRVAGLFEEAVSMIPLASWLPTMRASNPKRHVEVIELLDALVPNAELLADPIRGDYAFRRGKTELPFDALSDGYRAYIGWVADLLHHLCKGAPKGARLVDTRGIVLVDEIDLHLHPEWQRTVVPTLAEAFPNLQFILTTHSPLVVGSVHRQNVRVLLEDPTSETNATMLREPLEETFGLSADQILTGAHFGLTTTRNDAFLRKLTEVAHRAEEDPEATLEFLEMLTGGARSRQETGPAKRPTSRSRKSPAAPIATRGAGPSRTPAILTTKAPGTKKRGPAPGGRPAQPTMKARGSKK